MGAPARRRFRFGRLGLLAGARAGGPAPTTQTAWVQSTDITQEFLQERLEKWYGPNTVVLINGDMELEGKSPEAESKRRSQRVFRDDPNIRFLVSTEAGGEGINLQYFFSYIDSAGWGCGTKLPHNVTSLLGVMDGHASDLRSGLPWQGVEIHEPVRLLFLFETTPEMMFKIMQRNSLVNRVLRNGWGQLALLDPNSSNIVVFRNGEFVERKTGEPMNAPERIAMPMLIKDVTYKSPLSGKEILSFSAGRSVLTVVPLIV